MKYPIGIQQFEKLREDEWVYVDKTRQVYELVQGGSCYFLSRPRRFGKSLLLSTLEAYFQGKKHLFEGLAIENLEKEWTVHPVLHLDLNAKPFTKLQDLYDLLNAQLYLYEQEYESVAIDTSIEGRFRALIRAAKLKTGRNVVVLVDEYDKPMLQAIGNEELQTEFRNALKAFYGVLKSADGDLRFAMLTGVTRFSKVSVFSDLNNLEDISMMPQYHDICGISEKELHATFDAEVEKLAQVNEQTKEEAFLELQKRYDGYHFCANTPGMYNPFSVLLTLKNANYGSYWFSTGTPTYLVELMKEVDLNPKELSGYEADASELDSIQIKVDNPIAILYQSGYLTIKEYNPEFNVYVLDYPNEEVKEGFIKFLMPYYTYSKASTHSTVISKFVMSLRKGDAERFMQLMQSLMADIPYELVRDLENHYQNVMYIITKLMGLYIQAEYRTSRGRIDLLIGTDKYVYIIELKLDGSAEEALAQINAKDYALPFTVGDREVVKIGANVTSETRNLERWIIE
ncbi:MAG: AAA family ATPase, partial [Bacteroidaceae bacterium]|nr:AAA family ATPase [Bacteroidaceae bacterium]